MGFYEWRPYVSVAQRRANANREMQKLRKKGMDIEPVEIQGRKIARTFWGEGWCNHLEQFSDYANRLPRGKAGSPLGIGQESAKNSLWNRQTV